MIFKMIFYWRKIVNENLKKSKYNNLNINISNFFEIVVVNSKWKFLKGNFFKGNFINENYQRNLQNENSKKKFTKRKLKK